MNFWRSVTAKPWEHAGEMEGIHGGYAVGRPSGRTGLLMFLAVISSMFLLFIISYKLRMGFPDWQPVTEPGILWFNTIVLVLASLAMQTASNAARKDLTARMKTTLLAAGVLTLVFLAGQFLAWQQMIAAGYYAVINPANAFFYLFTGLHGLHLVGGLWFLWRAGSKVSKDKDAENARSNVQLCATYWHYLLLVWVVLFTLLLRT
jgi:cytochrome c oxidase subunit 3